MLKFNQANIAKMQLWLSAVVLIAPGILLLLSRDLVLAKIVSGQIRVIATGNDLGFYALAPAFAGAALGGLIVVQLFWAQLRAAEASTAKLTTETAALSDRSAEAFDKYQLATRQQMNLQTELKTKIENASRHAAELESEKMALEKQRHHQSRQNNKRRQKHRANQADQDHL